MDSSNGKFYWLKLKRDYFKRHDITILEAMPNGKEYSLFYLKLMLESVDHEGKLRFNEQIPYNEQMLASVTNTNIDVVRSAIDVLTKLELIEIWDDQTIYMTEVERMIGSASNTSVANRVRKCRENQKALQNVTKVKQICNESKSIELELDKELDIDIKKDINVEKKEPIASDFGACELNEMAYNMKKHKYGQYKNILLTEEEYEKLANMTNGLAAIEYLSTYREYKGYKAKSDYLAILKWVFNAMKEESVKQERLNRSTETMARYDDKSYAAMMLDADANRGSGKAQQIKSTRFTMGDKEFNQEEADKTTIPDEKLGSVEM